MNAGIELVEDPRQCWRTPRRIFDPLHARYRFGVDAAADASNALLECFWDRADDGLAHLADADFDSWRAWVNPPYADISPWVEACYDRCLRGAFSALLLPARTDRYWFHRYAMAGELHFFRGRVQFDLPPGVGASKSTNREWSMLVIFDRNTLNAGIVRSLTNNTAERIR